MSEPTEPAPKGTRRLRLLIGAAVLVVLVAAAAVAAAVREQQLAHRLLITEPSQIAGDAELVRYADGLARPVYAEHCAGCHGKEMQGDPHRGAPNLKDSAWLYESGGVGEIERTVLYGIRSGNAKSRNITDMPALGRTLQLSPTETRDVEAYVLALTGRPADPQTMQRGAAVFQGKGVCYDCHSADASGNPDYGAPALNDAEWLYGGDRESVYQSIYSGRHGVCPAWIGKLKPKVIRALAVYLNQISHPAPTQKGQVHG